MRPAGRPAWDSIGLYAVDATECTATGCQQWFKALLPGQSPPSDGQTTVIHRFFQGYGGPKRYWAGPSLTGAGSTSIRDQVLQRACADYRAGLTTKAAFTGGSRGAVIALDAARRTQTAPNCRVGGKALPVAFIGVVDAVNTSIGHLEARGPAGAPTFHRVKAQKWEHLYTTVDVSGAVVSVAPATNQWGTPLNHVLVIFHTSSLSWLRSTASGYGLPAFGQTDGSSHGGGTPSGACSSGGKPGVCKPDCYGMGAVWAIKGLAACGGQVCCVSTGAAPDSSGGSSDKPSCSGRCGSSSAVPGSSPACYCDSVCASKNDCCPDYTAVCSGGASGGGTPSGSCSSGGKQGVCKPDCSGMGAVWAIKGLAACGGQVCCIKP